MSTAHAISRRGLFRGQFAKTAEPQGAWHHVDGLAAGSGDVFWGGWADEAGVFAVGDDGTIFHFDGIRWERMAAPSPVPIHALWGNSRDDLYGVGWMGLIIHYDGQAWRQVRGCVVDAAGKYSNDRENTPLFGIAGQSDGLAWAVGDNGTILHFDGSDWVGENSGTSAHLRCVLCLDDETVLAAGGNGVVLKRGEDGQWSDLKCPVGSNFVAALQTDGESLLLAGGRYFVDANGFRGDLILYRDGQFHKLFEGAPFRRFRDIAETAQGIVAVGDGGQIFMIGNDRFDRLDSGTTHDLLGIVPLPNDEALVVGDFGTVLVGNEIALQTFAPAIAADETTSLWQPMKSGTDRQLWGVWADPESGIAHACGEDDIVLIEDRGRWETLPPVGQLGIHALARAPDGGLLAAGQMGEIHHFDGTSWRKHFDLHMDITLLSLWGDGNDELFAAGDEGLVLQWDGQDWTRMASGTKIALYGMWGQDAEHLLAVGDFGLVLRWNGKTWDSFNVGTENFLFDVWGRDLNDIFVVGLSGTIGHFDGTRWHLTPARARNDLLALAGSDRSVVAVGAGGIAVVHDGERWQLDPTGTAAGLRAVMNYDDDAFLAAGDGGRILRREPANHDN